jgi:hypothetical protein
MNRISTAAALVFALALSGCDSINGFDPLDKITELDIMGSSKTPLKGERRPVFESGVPGVPQGVPPEMVKGYQPPPEAPPPVVEAKPAKPKPKKTAAAPRKPPPPPPQTPQAEQAPPQRTTTQPVNQSAGGMQTMPGAQPTWPTNAQPAPGPWPGPQR